MADQREALREKVYRLTVQQRDAAWAECDALRADLTAANEREARLRQALRRVVQAYRDDQGPSLSDWEDELLAAIDDAALALDAEVPARASDATAERSAATTEGG